MAAFKLTVTKPTPQQAYHRTGPETPAVTTMPKFKATTPGVPSTAPSAAVAPPTTNLGSVNWASILGLDPGYTQATAAADAAAKNALIGYGADTFDSVTLDALNKAGISLDQGTLAAAQQNPFSTSKQLDLNLKQNLHNNLHSNNSRGTLFSGGTAQGAQNADRANQQSRFSATQALLSAITAAQQAKANALVDAQGRVISNPGLYGLSTLGDTPAPAAPAAAIPVVKPVTVAQLKKDPLAGQKAKNRY